MKTVFVYYYIVWNIPFCFFTSLVSSAHCFWESEIVICIIRFQLDLQLLALYFRVLVYPGSLRITNQEDHLCIKYCKHKTEEENQASDHCPQLNSIQRSFSKALQNFTKLCHPAMQNNTLGLHAKLKSQNITTQWQTIKRQNKASF